MWKEGEKDGNGRETEIVGNGDELNRAGRLIIAPIKKPHLQKQGDKPTDVSRYWDSVFVFPTKCQKNGLEAMLNGD